ncbi:tetratricopeptide repeat protein [Rhizobium sp. LjRoot30]|uniref:tetratricopeptide repeat protein n=1 Tax=Rhizobium sp. LjRoot30 TaxID=3342320 RepID=UPI003ED14D92
MSAGSAHTASHSKACISRAAGVGAVFAAAFVASIGMAQAAPATSQDDCDRLAGSRYDMSRNIAFKPVEEAALKSGEDAVTACRIAFSETGNPRFSFQLGRALDNRGDVADAMTAYAAAADDNYTIAKVHLGFLYGRMGDVAQEFALFTQAATDGSVLGAYNLAVLYRDGVGTQVDAAQAIRWFEEASKDYGPAAYNLGVIYDEGNLVPEDNARAIEWYKVAVAKGQVDAMVNLALMYEGGEGTQSNLMAAADLYRSAAEKGDQFAAQKFETIGAMIAALKEQQQQMQANSGANMPVIDPEAVGSISKDDTGI